MSETAFRSSAFPVHVAGELRRRLWREHAAAPFSAVDSRGTVRRVERVLRALGLSATVYRGALGLPGAEVDHLWVEVDGRVVDAALPVLDESFVALLRRFVAEDLTPEELASAAARATLDRRVVGEFPDTVRYIGAPLWSARRS
jgi:hypothetical protein